MIGSLLGFFGAFNFWVVLVARIIQVAGAQVAGSVFLVMTVKYLNDKEKAVYIGIYNAVYYLAAAIGVFAGGMITSFDWKYLFLVPAISVFFIPLLIKNTPDISAKGEKIDVVGIVMFAVVAGLIAIYFSFPNIWFLVATIVVALIFALYVWKGTNPFLSKKFVTNGAYMSILLVLFVFYFFNFACVPIYNVIGEQLYSISLSTVSLCLTLVYIVATVVGCVSGPLINKIGRQRTLIGAAILMIVGFAGSAIFIKTSFWLLTALACVFIAGVTVVYTPIYDAASDALPVEENGRGIGICDLMMNTSASIGMAVYSSLMANPNLAKGGLFGVGVGSAAQTSNMFWIMCGAAVLALIIIIVFRHSFEAKRITE